MDHPYLFWIGFHLFIAALLWVDLTFFKDKTLLKDVNKSLLLSGLWILSALLFNLFIYFSLGKELALQFFAGYLVEKSLSVDNLFVFLMIFTHFKVPPVYQHRILFYGILGAIVFRILLILTGMALIQHFHWMGYLLGLFLCFTGFKVAFQKEKELDVERNFLIRLLRRFLPLSSKQEGGSFVVRESGQWKMTQWFLVLLMIEGADLIFALDSIPAVFALSKDLFIIYTSNIFAILGLRELYFVLARFFDKLRYFKAGLSVILFFVGTKLFLGDWYPISLTTSLLTILVILLTTIVLSIRKKAT